MLDLFEYGFEFFKRNILLTRDESLEKYILESFNKIKKDRWMDLRKIIFYNLFIHKINNKLILIFRTTNIFDLSGHVWRNNIFPRYLLDHSELTTMVKKLLDHTDRGILKRSIENKDEILDFIDEILGDFKSIHDSIKEIKDLDLDRLMDYVPGLDMTHIDVIKDIRNILVHGFSVKNIYFYSPLENRFERYFFRVMNDKKINKLFDMMFLLNLSIFRVISDDEANDHTTNVE